MIENTINDNVESKPTIKKFPNVLKIFIASLLSFSINILNLLNTSTLQELHF